LRYCAVITCVAHGGFSCRYAFYALIIGVVYVVGLPATVFIILYRRRHKLFGDPKDPFVATTRSTFGFLYEVYGPTAWWWEVEELVRKLLLSAVVVLIEPGSPLQVRFFFTAAAAAAAAAAAVVVVAAAAVVVVVVAAVVAAANPTTTFDVTQCTPDAY
jgi:hypothetical protein